ncbi:hypothetical protein ABIB94_007113 [Bradyrhizobium sp. JR7.2]|uniref:hypothetical protein n=1 Tax=Bradyrhizobium sp. JR7.2 TaxID=3156375 RepID=UPI0033987391
MTYTAKERARDQRNLKPHAEARLAMAMWSHEYAHEQRGGSMDFWDSIGRDRQRLCIGIVSDVLEALKENGRATPLGQGKHL